MSSDEPLKPVLLVGKGISCRAVLQAHCDFYCVAAVSEAVRMCYRADYVGVNDTAALAQLADEDFRKTGTLVLPTYLHCDPKPRETLRYDLAAGLLPVEFIELYELPTAPHPAPDVPKFGVCWSTAESLVAFLIHKGYRDFLTTGVEKSTTEYHPLFKPRTVKKVQHFATNWHRIKDRIVKAGGTLRRWE